MAATDLIAADAVSHGSGHTGLSPLDRLESGLGRLVDIVAAALLLVDIVLLGWAVTARYLLNVPITWIEEVAMLVFLWFGMLGVASALRRKIHLRLTFVLSKFAPERRAGIERIAHVVLLVFLLKLVVPTLQLVELNHIVTTPNLSIPGSVPVLASLVSIVLMAVFLLIQMWRASSARAVLAQIVIAVAIAISLERTPPLLADLGNLNLLLFFGVGVMALIVIGVPIAFAFGAATVGYFTLTSDLPLTVIVGRINEGMSHFILLTIPLFIFLGIQIQYTGMARAMINFVAALIGSARGGLSYVMLCAMYLVSGISGAKAADMAAIGPILAPAMKDRGAKEGDIVALLAVSAAAAETIPPSLVLIIMGSVTGISIAALFIGGLVPAVVCMLALAVAVWLRSRNERRGEEKRDLKLIGKTFVIAMPALALPLIIRAAVLEGVATATEVAVIGIAYVAVVGTVMMRGFSLARMGEILVETVALTGTIMIIIALAGAMSWALTQSGFADTLVSLMTGLPGGKLTFLAVSIVAFIIFGSILEGIPAIVLFGPLLVPVAQSLGVHPVQYAMVVLLSMGLGLFSPPFGYGYYTACAIAKVSPDDAMWNMVPYLVALLVAIVLIAAFPWLSIGFL
ncbi:TRAP transporter large permease subunit [Bosea sp. (in: a-proteobacteria)]|jgi:tripartite ATP-independent transporter DctM subunit|uniref:TRAP transporter large permease n=1 Tax=Bosea sp. (in: a-proteobacteria) TaxID=1871050 RepID=UPI002DDD7829|nr:TRAP transporter large permease subunit [Bosea sp. (in: a-proteobacteria)]HEV2512079.1 TRAP transporter large permease subunit [Bosea sp. (in: a-proteobacteria)]